MSDPTLELAALVGTAIAGKPDVDREALHDVAIAVNPRLRARRAGCVPPPDNPPTQQPRNEEPMMTISTHWQERIDAAQAQPTVEIYGKTYRRIRYGEESHATKYAQCPDCRCELGQFHVPCCDVERCPRCGEQAIACDCGLLMH